MNSSSLARPGGATTGCPTATVPEAILGSAKICGEGTTGKIGAEVGGVNVRLVIGAEIGTAIGAIVGARIVKVESELGATKSSETERGSVIRGGSGIKYGFAGVGVRRRARIIG